MQPRHILPAPRPLRELDSILFLTPKWKLNLSLSCRIQGTYLDIVGLSVGPEPLTPHPSLFLLYSTTMVRQVLPALGKEESLRTRRFVWNVIAISLGPHCPLPVPLPSFASPRQNATEHLKQATSLGEVAQSSQCHRRHVAVSRLGHWHLEFRVNLWV